MKAEAWKIVTVSSGSNIPIECLNNIILKDRNKVKWTIIEPSWKQIISPYGITRDCMTSSNQSF